MWRRTVFLLLTCLGLLWAGLGVARADAALAVSAEECSAVYDDALVPHSAAPAHSQTDNHPDTAPAALADAVGDAVGDPSPSAELAEALLMAPPATAPQRATTSWLAHSDPRGPSALATHLLRPPSH